MLTSTGKDNDLVDGQQRFTVLMLIGIVMREFHPDWNKFLLAGDAPRLRFFARENDEKYLLNQINRREISGEPINRKMDSGIRFIRNWIEEDKPGMDHEAFASYIFKNTCFFISQLPAHYQGKELNKYFESMNSTGRNLESHEIQKIECLKGLRQSVLTKERATVIWNIASQMDKPIIRKKTTDRKTEDDSTLHARFENAISSALLNDLDAVFPELNEFSKETKEANKKKIWQIEKSAKKPQPHSKDSSYHGMLSFTEFLLQVLYIQLNSPKEGVTDFFDTQKLLETFKKFTSGWNGADWQAFFLNLLVYRLIFDYYLIRVPNEEDVNFDLEFSDYPNEGSLAKRKLRQYQAMLFAGSSSKSYYLWISPYFRYIADEYKAKRTPSAEALLAFLKRGDNQRNPLLPLEQLSYQSSPLYWFRRLDYYIWETTPQGSCDAELISGYRFRRGGRSIEHLHPQNEDKQLTGWETESIHCFGNLALISSSFNSTQGNDSVEVKFARVKNQIERNQLESIKLYLMYIKTAKDSKKWDEKLMKEHEVEMYQLLKESYH
jgi:hypothetical protein